MSRRKIILKSFTLLILTFLEFLFIHNYLYATAEKFTENSTPFINLDDTWTLERCIEYAIKNNPDLQSAEAKVRSSTYSLDFQRKLFFPSLDLTTFTGYLAGEPPSPFALLKGVTEEGIKSMYVSGDYIDAILTLSAPVLKEGVLFSKNAPTINMAHNQVLIDKNTYEAKKNEIIFGVSTSFFNLLKNKEDIKTAAEHVKSLRLDYEVATSKFKEELISKNELLIAEVKLASGEKELVTYRNLTQQLMADLSIKMGLERTKPITVSPEDFTLPPLPPLEELISTGLANRSEITAQEAQVSFAKEDQRLAQSQKYPNIDFISTYAVINDYGSRTNSLWTGIVQLKMPVFDFGAITAKVKSKEAKVTEEEKHLLSVKGSIIQEVTGAFTNIRNTMADITLKEKIVEQSTENVRLMRARFEQNLTPLSSLLEAEYTLFANQKALSEARYNLRLSYLELLKATANKPIQLPRE